MGSFNALRRFAFVVLAATTPGMAAEITVRPQFREPTADDTAKIESLYSQSVNAAELGDKFKEAQKLREALHILDITYGPMHPTTADKLDVMSNVYRDELAETLLRRALHIHESLGMEREAGWDMLDLGTVLVRSFRFHEAIDVLHAALKRLERDPPDEDAIGLAHFQLGLALSRIGRYDEAEASLQRSVTIRTAQQGANSMAVRQTLDGKGLNLLRMERYGEAEKTLRDAVNIAPAEQQVGRLRAQLMLGQTYIADRKYGDAAQIFSQAVALTRDQRLQGYPEANDAVVGLAEARRRLGDFAQAVQLFRQGCKFKDVPRSPDVYGDGVSVCLARAALAAHAWAAQGGGRSAADRPDALKSEAFEWAQAAALSRAAKALAGYGARLEAAARNASDAVRAYNTALWSHDAVERQYMDTFAEQDGKARRSALAERLASQEENIDRIGTRIADRSPLYWHLQDVDPIAITQIQARSGNAARLLGEDEILVEAFIPPDGELGLVFAATKERLEWAEIPLTASQVARIVEDLRTEIDPGAYAVGHDDGAKEPGAFEPALAHTLYKALFGAPQIAAILNDTSKPKLLFVPSGALFSFPPGLLVTKAPPATRGAEAIHDTAWLLAEKAIAVLPDVASLRTLRELLPGVGEPSSEPLLAFADPDFSGDGKILPCEAGALSGASPPAAQLVERDGAASTAVLRRYLSQAPLPCTRAEGTALRDMLGGTLLTSGQASKTELMRRDADGSLARQRVIAFMTHAFVVGDFGLAEPALALAAPRPGASPSDDGLLTMSEIARLTLNADWVILSACNTGAPESPAREGAIDGGQTSGLSGLTRSFFGAGTKALLVSNWQVKDLDAASLVPDVVRRHYRGTPRAQALQQAALEMMRHRNADPAAWGAFTLLGEPN